MFSILAILGGALQAWPWQFWTHSFGATDSSGENSENKRIESRKWKWKEKKRIELETESLFMFCRNLECLTCVNPASWKPFPKDETLPPSNLGAHTLFCGVSPRFRCRRLPFAMHSTGLRTSFNVYDEAQVVLLFFLVFFRLFCNFSCFASEVV